MGVLKREVADIGSSVGFHILSEIPLVVEPKTAAVVEDPVAPLEFAHHLYKAILVPLLSGVFSALPIGVILLVCLHGQLLFEILSSLVFRHH